MARTPFATDTGRMITVEHVTKRYGERIAVDDLTFTIKPGIVTGFLGPNGAGKSTTMRLILGLDPPDARHGHRRTASTTATWPRRCTRSARCWRPAQSHTGRSAYNHLLALAQTHGIARTRVDEVIELVGLEAVARKRVGSFSLGMGQRLGVASALLGDPATVVLDEPANGLDPEGIRWIRNLLRGLAAEGRTVFLSSHLMSEMEQTAEHLIVIGRGRLIADTDVASFVAPASSGAPVRVRSPQQAPLADAHRRGRRALRKAGRRRAAGLRADVGRDRRDRRGASSSCSTSSRRSRCHSRTPS